MPRIDTGEGIITWDGNKVELCPKYKVTDSDFQAAMDDLQNVTDDYIKKPLSYRLREAYNIQVKKFMHLKRLAGDPCPSQVECEKFARSIIESLEQRMKEEESRQLPPSNNIGVKL